MIEIGEQIEAKLQQLVMQATTERNRRNRNMATLSKLELQIDALRKLRAMQAKPEEVAA